jgi:hypothetical protein
LNFEKIDGNSEDFPQNYEPEFQNCSDFQDGLDVMRIFRVYDRLGVEETTWSREWMEG